MIRLVLVSVLLSACTHSIHMVHTSGFSPYYPIEQGEVISTRSEQFVVLGFVFDTDYVNQAYQELESQCVDGEITGITTQFSTSHGFLSWTNKILMQGRCYKKSVLNPNDKVG